MTQPAESPNPYEATETASTVEPQRTRMPRPRIWTVFVTLLVALVASGVASVIIVAGLAVAQISSGADPQEVAADLPRQMMNPPMFIGMLVLSQLGMGLVVFVAAKLSPEPFHERLGMRVGRVGLSAYPMFMVGSLFPLALGIGAANLVAKVIPPDESAMMLYEQMTTFWAIPFILLIGLLPGLMEEFLFRGYVQQRFVRRWSPAAAILVSSVIFGLFHVTPHAIAMATILGLWLGVIAWRTDSVWPTVCCHAFVNAIWNIWQCGQRLWGMPANPSLLVKIVIGVVIGVCFLIAVRLILRPSTDLSSERAAS